MIKMWNIKYVYYETCKPHKSHGSRLIVTVMIKPLELNVNQS